MPLPSFVKRVLLNEKQIKEHIDNLALKLNEFYQGRTQFVVCIGILSGCTMFMIELLKKVDFYCQVFFVKIESYLGEKQVQEPVMTHNLIPHNAKMNDADILIIDDIVDSSVSIKFLKRFIKTNFKPRSVKTAVLLGKRGLEKSASEVDWVATTVDNVFLLGYSLDYYGWFRFIPYIFEPDLPKLRQFLKMNRK